MNDFKHTFLTKITSNLSPFQIVLACPIIQELAN